MGVVTPSAPKSAQQYLQWRERELLRDLHKRRSKFKRRRRTAYDSCLILIKAREAVLGMRDDPWIYSPPKPIEMKKNQESLDAKMIAQQSMIN